MLRVLQSLFEKVWLVRDVPSPLPAALLLALLAHRTEPISLRVVIGLWSLEYVIQSFPAKMNDNRAWRSFKKILLARAYKPQSLFHKI